MHRFLLFFAAVLLLPVSWADMAPPQVNRFFGGLETLDAAFSQQVTNPTDGVLQDAQGHVWIQRPGRFRWHYTQPYEQELVADGKNLWVYDRDLEQVTVKPVSEVLTNTPAMLLSGAQPLEELFTIESIASSDDMHWFRLIPLAEDSNIESLHIGFAGEDLSVIRLVDGFGNETTLRFSAMVRNQAVAPERFVFDPPPGADVVGQPQ